jgi:hypothetical protein
VPVCVFASVGWKLAVALASPRFPPPWSVEVQPNHYVFVAKRKVATAGVCTVATDRPKATTSVGGKTANWNLINQAI